MSDILCAVCGEPWDSYGVRNGDMAPWEARLFREGAGCPCCEGRMPAGYDPDAAAEAHVRSVIMGDDDGDEDLLALAVLEAPARPPWRRPEDPVIWECAGCASKVLRDLDAHRVEVVYPEFSAPYAYGIAWRVEGKSVRQHAAWHADEWEQVLRDMIEGAAGAGQPEVLKAPEDRMVDGRPYCPVCASACGACGALTFKEELFLPQGKCHDGDAVCGTCYERIPRCSHCCEEWPESTPFNHEGYGPCCAETCARCKKERGEDVMLDAVGDCPACVKRYFARRERRRRASHRRRVRRGW